MLKRTVKMALAVTFVMSTLLSCKKNTNAPDDGALGIQKDAWAVYTKSTTGWDGSIFMLNGKPSGELDLSVKMGRQLKYAGGGRTFNHAVYKIGDDASNSGIHRLLPSTTGKIESVGFLATPGSSGMNFHISDAAHGYYSDSNKGTLKIQTFNPTTMMRTGEIDLSSLSRKGDKIKHEAAGQLIIAEKGGKLFVDLRYSETVPSSSWVQLKSPEDEVLMAVIDIRSGKYESTTSYPNAGNLGLYNDHPLWSVDAVTGNLYIVAISDMKTQNPASKILRIKRGETSFDSSFELSVSQYQPKSDFNRLFAYNGKIYTTIASRPASYYNKNHGQSYRADIWRWAEIDVNTKLANYLDIPVDSFYSYQQPFFADGHIYFISNNQASGFSGVSELNLATGATKETFRLKNSGVLMGFNKLN